MIVAIVISIYGLLFLIRGKGMGKDAIAHPHYRLLGGFLLTFLPVQLVIGFLWGMVMVLSNPDMTEEAMKDKLTIPSLVIGFGMLVVYLVIAHFWEKSIKRRAAAARPV